MPAPHSYDLRKRAMTHFERYGSATLTGKTFNISRSLIYDWERRKQETGDIRAKAGYQNGYGHKVVDLAKFQQQVANDPSLTLSGIVKKSGIKMSTMTCSRALKKLNLTRKKRPLGIKSKMKKNVKRS